MKVKVKNTNTLLEVLLKEGGYATTSKAREIIKNGAVWVNDAVIKIPSTVIEAGASLEVNAKRSKQEADHAKYLFKVLFEDEFLVAVVKPPRIKVDKEMSGKPGFKDIVLEAMQKEKNLVTQLYPINYIETNSTGVLLMAKNQKTAVALQAHSAIKKTWAVLVEGKVKVEAAKLEFPLIKLKTGKLMAIEKTTKLSEPASTNYKVKKITGNFTLLEVTADDAKPKQFQAHFQFIGHPVAGDKKYGSEKSFSSRNGLHLEKIFFIHPVHNKPVQVHANIPQTFSRAGRYL